VKRIFKYPLEIIGQQTLVLPLGAQILSVQFQRGVLCCWAIAEEGATSSARIPVRIYGTGHECDADLITYKTTVQDHQGFVWHVFIDLGYEGEICTLS
jgi:hypothetical protein